MFRVTTAEEAAVSQEFEGAVASGGSDALKGFCGDKRGQSAAKEEAETWGFLGILFEDDARRELLKHLEFGDALVAKETAATEAGRRRRRRRRGEGRRRGGSGGGGGCRRRRACAAPSGGRRKVLQEPASPRAGGTSPRLPSRARGRRYGLFQRDGRERRGPQTPSRASRPSSSRPHLRGARGDCRA